MQRIAPHKTSIFVHIAIYLLVFRQTGSTAEMPYSFLYLLKSADWRCTFEKSPYYLANHHVYHECLFYERHSQYRR